MTTHRRHTREPVARAPTGDPRPTVPDLIGLSVVEASEAAAWAGIKLSATGTEHHGPVGVVVAQSPSPGTRMKPLWKIHVLVSAALHPKGSADA